MPAYSRPPDYIPPRLDEYLPDRIDVILCAGDPIVVSGLDYPTLSLSTCQQGGLFTYRDAKLSRDAGHAGLAAKDAMVRGWLSSNHEAVVNQENTGVPDTGSIYNLPLTFGMGHNEWKTNPLSRLMYSRRALSVSLVTLCENHRLDIVLATA